MDVKPSSEGIRETKGGLAPWEQGNTLRSQPGFPFLETVSSASTFGVLYSLKVSAQERKHPIGVEALDCKKTTKSSTSLSFSFERVLKRSQASASQFVKRGSQESMMSTVFYSAQNELLDKYEVLTSWSSFFFLLFFFLSWVFDTWERRRNSKGNSLSLKKFQSSCKTYRTQLDSLYMMEIYV